VTRGIEPAKALPRRGGLTVTERSRTNDRIRTAGPARVPDGAARIAGSPPVDVRTALRECEPPMRVENRVEAYLGDVRRRQDRIRPPRQPIEIR
jgi:hypothetical protein